jgi:hypothetical protein
MKKRTITSFISSKNRSAQDTTCDFGIDYPDDGITCKDTEYIELNVVSFDLLNSMYNINDNNNKCVITRGVVATTYTIPAGNYSVKTFLAILQSLIDDPLIIIAYNTAQNTYTFKKGITATTICFNPHLMKDLLNMPVVDHEITSAGVSTGFVNLVNYSKIMLRTQGITYYQSNLENLQYSSAQQLFSDVIFWKSKNDIEPFRMISYSNEDAGNNFSLILQDRGIYRVQLQLKNELNQFITDAPDYMLVIQFNIYDKPTDILIITIMAINKILNDFYMAFLTIAQNIKLL